jgi:hypothetical protein
MFPVSFVTHVPGHTLLQVSTSPNEPRSRPSKNLAFAEEHALSYVTSAVRSLVQRNIARRDHRDGN